MICQIVSLTFGDSQYFYRKHQPLLGVPPPKLKNPPLLNTARDSKNFQILGGGGGAGGTKVHSGLKYALTVALAQKNQRLCD
jgi:hypothetical protein